MDIRSFFAPLSGSRPGPRSAPAPTKQSFLFGLKDKDEAEEEVEEEDYDVEAGYASHLLTI